MYYFVIDLVWLLEDIQVYCISEKWERVFWFSAFMVEWLSCFPQVRKAWCSICRRAKFDPL